MDEFSIINRLRARFLDTFGEKDQVYRVIRPYYGRLDSSSTYSSIVNNANVTGISGIDVFYQDNLGNNMLEFLESPPITSNSMDTFMSKNVVHRNYHRSNNLVYDKALHHFNDHGTDSIHMESYKSRFGEFTNTKLKDNSTTIPLINNGTGEMHKNDEKYDRNNEKFGNTMQHDSLYNNSEFDNFYNNEDSIYNYEDTVQSSGSKKKLNKKAAFRFKNMFNRTKRSSDKDSYIEGDEDESIKFSFYNSMNNEPLVNHKNTNSHVSRQPPGPSRNVISKNLSKPKLGNIRRRSMYSMNFDYDENIEDDDEDEDEDEDETKKKNNFFNIEGINTIADKIISTGMQDGKPSLDESTNKNSGNAVSNGNINVSNNTTNMNHNSGYQSYSSVSNSIGNQEDKKIIATNTDNINNNNNSSNTTIAGNVSRFKAHFPQLSKGMILDSQRNITSRSDTTSVLKNDSNEALKVKSDGVPEENVSDQYEITDIDSFINGKDLDDLHLMELNDVKDGLHHNSFMESELLTNKYENDMSNIPGNLMSATETDYISDESSYGKSLLESDLSREFSDKKDSSTFLSDSLSINSSIPHNTISSHSIPLSLEGYGTYRIKDNLSASQVPEQSIIGGRYGKSIKNRGRKDSVISLRESMPRSVSNRRLSLVSSHLNRNGSALKTSMRLTSSNTVENPVLPVSSEDGIIHSIFKCKSNNSRFETHKIVKKDDKLANDNKEDQLFFIEKKINLKPHKLESHLTSLFKKDHVSEGSKTEMLDYFTFVSGDTVPPSESMKLYIYIQDSKKYKKNNFTTTVRRSATIFEVIGYILYLYSTKYLPEDMSENELDMKEIIDPNNFNLKIVDEDGEPFEDNFGKLNRLNQICSVSDNEVVLCKASSEEVLINEKETPLPYKIDMKNGETRERGYSIASSASSNKNENTLNQLSFYKSIISKPEDINNSTDKTNIIEITVYKYPNVNPKYNYTNIKVPVTASINNILVKYCRLKNMDPNGYALKIIGKNYILDLNDTVLRLDGNYEIEIISKKEVRMLQLEKIKPDLKKPKLPTIQSNDLTPLTLESVSYMNKGTDVPKPEEEIKTAKITKGKNSSKHKLVSMKTNMYGGGSTGFSSTMGNSFFKNKNTSKSSLQGTTDFFHHSNRSHGISEYTPDSSVGNNYQDIFSGAYHKYKVWRRQQMSLINKHERTLALDGDYIYVVPPEGKMHWHENVKTKSFHINQVVLVKRSKKVPVNFKLYVQRGEDDIKRYYFEAVSPQECAEIVSRIHNLLTAYRMNHK
ncbi:Avo1p PWA37_003967 [Arxiozyma heterogenica]|uniref:Avo1p n=1 Tax=Arxiozyma heterogenica TaxID=278026 RepID=UPI002EF8E7F4